MFFDVLANHFWSNLENLSVCMCIRQHLEEFYRLESLKFYYTSIVQLKLHVREFEGKFSDSTTVMQKLEGNISKGSINLFFKI